MVSATTVLLDSPFFVAVHVFVFCGLAILYMFMCWRVYFFGRGGIEEVRPEGLMLSRAGIEFFF